MADDIHGGLVAGDSLRLRRGWLTIVHQVKERHRPCPQTLPMEKALGEFALINGLWSVFFPGGFSGGGWSVARLVIPQEAYGWACLSLAGFALFAYAHGAIMYRRAVCYGGILIALAVAPLIALGNPLSPMLPMFLWIARRRWTILQSYTECEAEDRRRKQIEDLTGDGDEP